MTSSPSIRSLIQQRLQTGQGPPPDLIPISGGSINHTYQLAFEGRKLFVKTNSASKFPHLFQKEKNGLEQIARQNGIRTPGIVDCFEGNGHQVLILEWIGQGAMTSRFWKLFGTQLAALHHISAPYYGLHEDNFMGSLPQSNKTTDNWSTFFIHQRLEPLVARCTAADLLTNRHRKQFENLYLKLPGVFEPAPRPSFLHGDLWSGNFICNERSEPVLIDPAIYFGHSSVDLGMTTLFGGFPPAFYEAYHYHAPFPTNYKEQWQAANLYPLLVHLLLFGKVYLRQVEQILHEFE
jgi:fructosamine-3-kinase